MLGFAGGTMLYVTSDDMIPEPHAHGYQTGYVCPVAEFHDVTATREDIIVIEISLKM